MQNEYNKWQSRRWLAAVWAAILIVSIVIFLIIEFPNERVLEVIIGNLFIVIYMYIGSETITKSLFLRNQQLPGKIGDGIQDFINSIFANKNNQREDPRTEVEPKGENEATGEEGL